MNDGATALFGEKYGEIVRTVIIGGDERISFELCGGTHVDETGDIGLFLITSEGSAAAGIRRIEAVTGRAAYALVQQRTKLLKQSAALMQTSQEELPKKIELTLATSSDQAKQIAAYRIHVVGSEFQKQITGLHLIGDSAVYSGNIPGVDLDTMRSLTDQFKAKYASGVVILATIIDDKPSIVVSVSDDLVKNGINAGEIARAAAQIVGGSGGGRPNLAQAGGKDASRLKEALEAAENLVKSKLIK
jgi:alanyl-tRNA synthetase